MENEYDVNVRELMESVVSFVRSFGLHKPDQTPCGQPVATAEAHALMDLAAFGPMRQRELASRLKLEKSTVSRLTRKMEANRWIQRACGCHGRAILIELTKQGREAATQLARARQAKFARILSAIPPDKQSMVVEAVSILEGASCQSEGPQERLRSPLLSSGPLRSEACASASSIPSSQRACSLKNRGP